ncbi:MAG: tetratricopeptide repeat protein [Tepidisphaeraceae bacterium]|jgi:tetratricopeptide (TPR) repeat protein
MAGRAFVSRFSPNRTDPKVLEAIFVQRHRLAEVWLERLRDSVLTGAKHHVLAVGPRGCGKSHLVNLLVHRLRKDPAIAQRVRIAQLPEDEATTSFWKFLLRILRALNSAYADEFPLPPRDQLDGAADDRRAAVLKDYLLNKLGGRTLLVVVENLDDVMRGLKDEGQKRWRAFLQEHAVAATLATAQQLTEDISNRDRPFFNFFQIEHLQPLSADEALSLLRKIAEQTGNTSLAAFLQTATGRARVRAIRHIAGGGHRVFIILSEFASEANMDNLVDAFEELLDELTPFYQERLRWLPDQQREIVEFLCQQTRTVPVKHIAGELFLSEQTAAAQLKSLKDKGYVKMETVGRESRYELAEPLMRLCVEVKDPQREPIRLIVEFLRIWYDRAGIEARLQCLPEDADLERRYFLAALERAEMSEVVKEALDRDLEAARSSGDPEEVVRVLVDLAATADSVSRCRAVAEELGTLGRHVEALLAWERATELDPNDAITSAYKGLTLGRLERYAETLTACERAITLDPKSCFAWSLMGWASNRLGRHAEGLAAHERAAELEPENAAAWNNKASALNLLGQHTEALMACERAIALDPKFAHAWANRGRAKLGLGQIDAAKEDISHAIELKGNYAGAMESLAEVYVLQGNWPKAERVLTERFRLLSSPEYHARSRHLPKFIASLFRASTDRNVWAYRVGRLADIAAEAKALAQLGDSLVRSLTRSAYAQAPAETLEAWAGVWAEVAQRHPDLSLAARLFGVGVRYVRTKDERVLFDLLHEERAILRELFGLDN